MKIPFSTFINKLFDRNVAGDSFYSISQFQEWANSLDNLTIAQSHPILTPGLLFVSKLFSLAEFYVVDENTGKRVKDHEIIKLLKKPNFYQTREDFLETLLFRMIAEGKSVVLEKKATKYSKTNSLYILNPKRLEFPQDYESKILNQSANGVLNFSVKYKSNDLTDDLFNLNIDNLLFFYDLPNCLSDNFYENKSRLDGLKQTLINTLDSLTAKNIILKSNGKEIISGKKDSFPLTNEEKEQAERIVNNNYGLGFFKKRALVTKGEIYWKSMHIALRDLGLDESVKVDGNLIYTALHIPKDILSLEAKKTTYNNFKESMVSYIQNEMQPTLDSACSVLQKLIKEPNLKLVGSYDHLPIMKFVLIEEYDGLKKRGEAVSALRNAGLPDDVVLELCNFDKKIKLNERTEQNKPKENQGDNEE